MTDSWYEAVITPHHEKGDTTECSKYRGIFSLNPIYIVLSKVLLNQLILYAEEFLGEYQCEFC